MPNGEPAKGRAQIQDVAEALGRNVQGYVEGWLPGGKSEGREYVARNPTRSDKSPGSFKVNMDTGAWSDFATGDKGGDLVSLYAYLNGMNNGQAAQELAERHGIGGASSVRQPQPATSGGGAKPDTKPAQVKPVPEGKQLPNGFPVKGEDGSWSDEPWTAIWEYRDSEGRTDGYVARFDSGGDGGAGKPAKQFRPLIWGRDGNGKERWTWRDFDKPYGLYGLDLLAADPDARVLIVEGEKCADAANRELGGRGWVAVTWPGGANRAKSADLGPLDGRSCVCWPDNDAPGRKAMQGISAKLGGAPVMEIPDGYPQGWDAADASDLGGAHRVHDFEAFIAECTERGTGAAGTETRGGSEETLWDNQHYRVEGITSSDAAMFKCVYFKKHGSVIVSISADRHTKDALTTLAPQSFFNEASGAEGSASISFAKQIMIEKCCELGDFDPSTRRGRGVWEEAGEPVIHLGDRLYVGGRELGLSEHAGEHRYTSRPGVAFDTGRAATK